MTTLHAAIIDFGIRLLIAYLYLRYNKSYYRKVIDQDVREHKLLLSQLIISEEPNEEKNKKLLESFNRLRRHL